MLPIDIRSTRPERCRRGRLRGAVRQSAFITRTGSLELRMFPWPATALATASATLATLYPLVVLRSLGARNSTVCEIVTRLSRHQSLVIGHLQIFVTAPPHQPLPPLVVLISIAISSSERAGRPL